MRSEILKQGYWFLPFIVCFSVVAFFQFRLLDCRAVFFADSAGYLTSALELSKAYSALTLGNFALFEKILTDKPFVERFLIDGPVIPLWGALAFILAGKAPTSYAWPVMVFALAWLNALVAAIMAILVKTSMRSKIMGLAAGIVWACYPGAALASGRYLTEPLTAFWIILSIALGACLVKVKHSSLRLALSAVQGLVSGSGILLKPALLPLFICLTFVPLLLSASLFEFDQGKKKISKAQLVAIALAAVFFACGPLAWACYTKFADGHFYFFPQRVPLLNIVVGHDLETDGWCVITCTATFQKLMQLANSFSVLIYSWQHHFLQTGELYFRKIPRIVGLVWNDFKHPFYGLNLWQQNLYHSALVALAACGAIFYCFSCKSLQKNEPLLFYLLTACLLTTGCHILMYLPFESCARYGYPAFPCIVILAVYALKRLLAPGPRLLKFTTLFTLVLAVLLLNLNLVGVITRICDFQLAICLATGIKVAITLIGAHYVLQFAQSGRHSGGISRLVASLAIVLLVIMPLVLTQTKTDYWRETAINMPRGSTLRKVALLPDADSAERTAYVLIDCNCDSDRLSFRVNGIEQRQNMVLLASRDFTLEKYISIGRMLAYVTDKPLNQFRHWRILELPPGLTRAGLVSIELTATGDGVKIYGDLVGENERTCKLLSRKLVAYSRAYEYGPEMEARLLDTEETPLKSLACQRQVPGAGNHAPIKDTLAMINARVFLLTADGKQNLMEKKAQSENLKSAVLNFEPSLFDPVTRMPGIGADEISVNRYTLQDAKHTGATIKLPQWCAHTSQLEFTLSGELKSTGRLKNAGILMDVSGPKGITETSILPGSAPYIQADSNWTKFAFEDYLDNRSTGVNKATMVLFPGRPEQIMQYGIDQHVGSFLFRNLKLAVKEKKTVDFSACELNLY